MKEFFANENMDDFLKNEQERVTNAARTCARKKIDEVLTKKGIPVDENFIKLIEATMVTGFLSGVDWCAGDIMSKLVVAKALEVSTEREAN